MGQDSKKRKQKQHYHHQQQQQQQQQRQRKRNKNLQQKITSGQKKLIPTSTNVTESSTITTFDHQLILQPENSKIVQQIQSLKQSKNLSQNDEVQSEELRIEPPRRRKEGSRESLRSTEQRK